MRNLYADNILLHAETTSEALVKYSQGKAIFAKSGMNLREFVSNSETVNNHIPENDRIASGNIKFLGVPYNTETDMFNIKVTFTTKDKMTKKDVVSQLKSVYDPIGVTGPLLVKIKLLMGEIYEAGRDWNQVLPNELVTKWNTVCLEVTNTEVSVLYVGVDRCF